MVKNKKVNGKPKRASPRVGMQRNTRRVGLDGPALQYARLLQDPCSAPLTHPIYGGGESGILTRFESDFIMLVGATDTAGLLAWTPGGIGTTGALPSHLFFAGATSTSAAATVAATTSNVFAPGLVFLAANSNAARCVSACMQIYWPGSEANRQGIVATGVTSGNAIQLGASVTVDGVSNMLTVFERMPTDYAEIKWKPADGDQITIPPGTNTAAAELARKNSLVMCIKGIPVSTGVRVRLVAVYEWQPILSDGITNPVTNDSPSSNSLEQVLAYLSSVNPNWLYKSAGVAMRMAGAIAAVQYRNTRARAGRIEL